MRNFQNWKASRPKNLESLITFVVLEFTAISYISFNKKLRFIVILVWILTYTRSLKFKNCSVQRLYHN